MRLDEIDRSNEVRGEVHLSRQDFSLEVPISVMGALLCLHTHPVALELGTIAPLVPCGSSCRQYPKGHPTTWRWP